MDNTALYNIGYGLYVLSAREDGRDNGCIINTLVQVTSSPLVAAVGVNKQNFTHDMIMRTGEFNISMLTVDAPFEVYKRFGFQSGRTADKFADFAFQRAANGIAFVPDGTNAYLSLKVREAKDMGTHTLFLAEITDAVKLSGAQSVTYAYYQANVKPKPKPAAPSGKTVWRCVICGYEYEGEELPADFICPICKHGAADFIKITG